jgi:dihydrofolate reductase
MTISILVAAADNDVIGVGGDLPWHISADLRRFRSLTLGHVVVAGRRTHDSIVRRLGHPLDGRLTVVVTRSLQLRSHDQVIYQPDVVSALAVARAIEEFAGRDEVFVIGGAEIFAQALPMVDQVHLTRVHITPPGDAVMPAGWLAPFTRTDIQLPDPGKPSFTNETYRRK